MILADKIVTLRKKAGWSQEELAQQLNVTRQSVSKWEGAQSIPDMEKILQMSRLFGVTTDFLLKDEMEAAEAAPEAAAEPIRRVTMEEASRYLELRRQDAPKMALATLLCILSPVALLLMTAMSQETVRFHLSEEAAAGIGLCVLLLFVAAGVFLFLTCAARSREFQFLEESPFETEYGVTGMVKERRKAFQERYGWIQILGVVLCVLAAVPLFLAISLRLSDLGTIAALCLVLLVAGCGCFALVHAGCRQNSMDKLLQEGEFHRSRRRMRRLSGTVSAIYWLVVTALFLICTFGPSGNGDPGTLWWIWAVAGVLFGAVMAVIRLTGSREKEREYRTNEAVR